MTTYYSALGGLTFFMFFAIFSSLVNSFWLYVLPFTNLNYFIILTIILNSYCSLDLVIKILEIVCCPIYDLMVFILTHLLPSYHAGFWYLCIFISGFFLMFLKFWHSLGGGKMSLIIEALFIPLATKSKL